MLSGGVSHACVCVCVCSSALSLSRFTATDNTIKNQKHKTIRISKRQHKNLY